MRRLSDIFGRWTLGVVIASTTLAGAGIAASLGWAWYEATEAEAQWRERAWREASALTGDVDRELLQVEAQMRALSLLFLASDRVDGAELLAAEAVVPAASNSATVESLAYASATGPLAFRVSLPSGTHDLLAQGVDLATLPAFRIPALAALERPGTAVMGPAYRVDQRWFAAFAIAVSNAGDQGLLFGVLDLQAMLERTFSWALPGLQPWLRQFPPSAEPAAAPSAGPAVDLQTVFGTPPPLGNAVSTYVQSITHGRSQWQLEWRLLPEYRGGVDYHPAWMAAIGGSLLSVMIAAAIAALSHQNTMIRRQVEQRTAELSNAVARVQRVSKAKTNFLAIVGHELRTPLNAVIGFADLIERQQADEPTRRQARFVLDSGRHLLRLINDLLDVANAESGQLQLVETEVDPASLVDDITRKLAPMAAAIDVGLSADVEPGLPRLRADGPRLKQALESLCLNALHASARGGQVQLSACRLAPEGAIALLVADRGQGMTEEQLASAFELFGQVDDHLTRRWEGLGIGLPLCRHLVELHGGRLRLDTRPGEGTTAAIELPASRAVEAGPQAA